MKVIYGFFCIYIITTILYSVNYQFSLSLSEQLLKSKYHCILKIIHIIWEMRQLNHHGQKFLNSLLFQIEKRPGMFVINVRPFFILFFATQWCTRVPTRCSYYACRLIVPSYKTTPSFGSRILVIVFCMYYDTTIARLPDSLAQTLSSVDISPFMNLQFHHQWVHYGYLLKIGKIAT